MALELAKPKVKGGPADLEPVRPSHHQTGDQCWDFVGLVVEDSTVQKPTIFLGCAQAFLPADKLLLLRYRNTRGGIYTLDLDGGQWVESKESLTMKVAPAKGRAYGQQLQTSLRTIHKAVMDRKQES